MIFTSKNISIELSDKTYGIISCKVMGKELCAEEKNGPRPLFTIKLLDKAGNSIYFNSLNAEKVCVDYKDNSADMKFLSLCNYNLSVYTSVKVADNGDICWSVSLDNDTEFIAEWIEFPQLIVIDSLKAEGGEFELFWPVCEGIVVDTKKVRNSKWMAYKELGGQSGGYNGYFPGSCPMQFMAYYNGDAGLYFASHDKYMNPKTVEFREENDGIALEFMRNMSTSDELFTIEIDPSNMSREEFYTHVRDIFQKIYETVQTTRKDLDYASTMPDGLKIIKERFRNDDPDIGQDFTI